MVTYNEAMRKAVENATPGSYEHAAQFWLGYARELRENFLTLSADNREQLGDEEPFPRRADIVHPFVMGEDSLCAATGCGGLQNDARHLTNRKHPTCINVSSNPAFTDYVCGVNCPGVRETSDPAKTVVLDVEGFGDPEKLRISPLVRPMAPGWPENGCPRVGCEKFHSGVPHDHGAHERPAAPDVKFCYCGEGVEHVYRSSGCLNA